MFLSPFDPGYDFEPPSGSALLAEIGIDPHPPGDPGRCRGLAELGRANGIAAEVLFLIQLEPTLLHQFDPQ